MSRERFCYRPGCPQHVHFNGEKELLFPVQVRNHIEYERISRIRYKSIYLCSNCWAPIDFLCILEGKFLNIEQEQDKLKKTKPSMSAILKKVLLKDLT